MIIQKTKGFTLVELIIVITILAILASISFVSFSGYISQSRDTKRLADLLQIEKALYVYEAQYSKVPVPSNYNTYTSAKNDLYVGTFNNKVLSNVSGKLEDPLTKEEYLYATYDNGKYFQLGGFGENEIALNIGNTTYADNNYAIVKGNYLFDPSLPSLLISSGGTNIYDSNNCFILSGEDSKECIKKSDLNLSKFDDGLMGYWDMETLTSSGSLKDLSGNGYNLEFGGNVVNLSTGALIGKGYKFDGSSILYTQNEINYNSGKTLTLQVLVKSVSGPNNFQVLVESSDSLVDNMGSYLIDDFDKTLPVFKSYKNSGAIGYGDKNYNISRSRKDSVVGYKLLTMVLANSSQGPNITLYINGEKQYENSSEDLSAYKNTGDFTLGNYKLNFGNRYKTFLLNNSSAAFYGIMDEVKLYNRELSEDEILQQAKISGF